MSLAAGARLGPYQVLGFIGAGGMGEVYKAKDTRLDRTVAIKVLPDHVSRDPDRRARFEREAKSIAGLTHPNICTLHDVGEHAGSMFLVMELLDGETLAHRLEKGPLPIEQALTVATEIADALSAAHRHGIIHRDLKPSNVMLTKSGAKLLDFGLAKLAAHGDQAAISFMSATRSAPLTGEGIIVGTLQYMAPEQLEGKPTDARTDLWAFGAVVYEMLTGKRAFEATSAASLIGAILERDPAPAATLQPLTPPQLDRVVAACLAKDPEERWQSMSDLTRELKWIAAGGSISGTSAPSSTAAGFPERLGWIAAVLALALIGGWVGFRVAGAKEISTRPQRLSIPLPAGRFLQGVGIALSRDGTRLIYSSYSPGTDLRLYLRRLDRFEATAIAGTEGAVMPFLSPDEQWVGFFAGDKLWKVPVTGGVPEALCDVSRYDVAGADWAEDNTILFGRQFTGLLRVSAAGGVPQPATTLDKKNGELSHLWPQILPGGKAVLFTVQGLNPQDLRTAIESLATHERRNLTGKGAYARYASSGHLVYAWDGSLLAKPFDLARLEVTGPELPILANLAASRFGAVAFAISGNGSLVYAIGGAPVARTLVWVDRQGNTAALRPPARAYFTPRLSPDGQQLALGVGSGARSDVWTYDIARDVLSQFTNDGSSHSPIWTPDGRRLVFSSQRAGPLNLFWQPIDRSGLPERLLTSENPQWAGSFTADGRQLAFMEFNDISIVPLLQERQPQPLLRGSFIQYGGRISPDGRWLAYVSNETGRWEVYVTAFPSAQGKWPISTEGGAEVVWAKSGHELYYREGDKLMVVRIETVPNFTSTKPTTLFSGYLRGGVGLPAYDVHPDGKRFVMLKDIEPNLDPQQLNVVLDWFEELKRPVPTK